MKGDAHGWHGNSDGDSPMATWDNNTKEAGEPPFEVVDAKQDSEPEQWTHRQGRRDAILCLLQTRIPMIPWKIFFLKHTIFIGYTTC